MKGYSSLGVGVGAFMMSIACSEVTTPVSPSHIPTVSISAEVPDVWAPTDDTQPVITMLSDYTVSPSYVQVKTGYQVKVVNNSDRRAQLHSYNCSEFQMVDPDPGTWINTGIFRPAGKVCDYFAWDTNWSRKIFVGQVEVVP